jgi:hypothetical protein
MLIYLRILNIYLYLKYFLLLISIKILKIYIIWIENNNREKFIYNGFFNKLTLMIDLMIYLIYHDNLAIFTNLI